MCVKNLNFENFFTFSNTFSALILGSVFNDYVVFYGDSNYTKERLGGATRIFCDYRPTNYSVSDEKRCASGR